MKQALKSLSTLALALALVLPVSLLAQKEDKDKEAKEKNDVEQIIITRKGDKSEKVVIELNGEKVIVNGKEVKDKDGDVTVNRMKFKELNALTRYPRTIRGGDAMTFFSEDANRAMLGVVTEKTEEGLEIQDVTKESAAEKAGLKPKDVITKINDKAVSTPDELSELIRKQKPGDKVTVTYLRDKKENKVTAELTKWKGVNAWTMGPDGQFKIDLGHMDFEKIIPKVQVPRVPGHDFNWSWTNSPKLGLSIQDTDDGKGVKVVGVGDESNAEKAGIKEDDVILEVNGKAVNGVDEMTKIIRESKDKVSVMLKLSRAGKTQNVEVKMPRRIRTADL